MAETRDFQRTIFRRLTATFGAVFLLSLPGGSRAQTFEILHTFRGAFSNPTTPLVQAGDGNFYGTTSANDSYYRYGTVFRLTPSGVTTTLHYFTGSDGIGPNGLVLGTDGNLYGTTSRGGPTNGGTVFRVTTTGTFVLLYAFSGSDGSGPQGSLAEGTDGNFYGTTCSGGYSPGGTGTVFRISSLGALDTLHRFSATDGSCPSAGLVQGSDGNFYGTTLYGGPQDNGTVFGISPSGTLSTLHLFSSSDGRNPRGELSEGVDGAFYGTTAVGGPGEAGTVFKVTPSGLFTSIYSFYTGGPAVPSAGLVRGSDGNFYGTTRLGGSDGFGTVFVMSPAGSLSILHSFTGFDGAYPTASLVQASDGDYYGTTSGIPYTMGGFSTAGSVFRITPAGDLTVLFSFDDQDAGASGPVIQGTDGNLYGASTAQPWGALFSLAPSDTLALLHVFGGGDGRYPRSPLSAASDGTFFGATQSGGLSDFGTVFHITPTGSFKALHSFLGADGRQPWSSPVQGTDGNLYGTTVHGGLSDAGTVYKLTPTGSLATLHSFSLLDGQFPSGPVVEGSDGAFYGTTPWGGAGSSGTIFRVAVDGTFTSVHSFLYNEDGSQVQNLVSGGDGNFYGTTAYGGSFGFGTFFKVTPSGEFTILHHFSTADGGRPLPLISVRNGFVYGITSGGGGSADWTIFSLTTSGTFSSIFTVPGDAMLSPLGVVAGRDGYLYGSAGGPAPPQGLVFRLDTLGARTPLAVTTGSTTICSGDPATIQAKLTGTPPWTLTWSDGFAQTGVTTSPATRVISPTTSMAYSIASVSDAITSGLSFGSTSVTVTPALSQVSASLTGASTVCTRATGGTISSSSVGGGTVTYQWGYRSVSGGLITPIPLPYSSPSYLISSPDFPSPGTFFVVVTVIPTCGPPVVSNEVLVTIAPTPETPVITAPSTVGAGSPNRIARVPEHAGSIYSWGVSNGTITAGDGTNQVTFTAGSSGTLSLWVVEKNAYGCSSQTGSTGVTIAPPGSAVLFYTVPPCRVADTRAASGFPSGYGPPTMAAGSQRDFVLAGQCGIPSTATAVSANVTVWTPTVRGDMRVFPAGGTLPDSSLLNWEGGILALANAGILQLSPGGAVTLKIDGLGPVDVILDVNGYFQ